MHRAVVLRFPVGHRAVRQCADAMAQSLAASGYDQIMDRRGVLMLMRLDAGEGPPIVLNDETGIVLGHVYRSPGGERAASVSREVELDWLQSSSQALIDNFWGPYLAFLADRERDRLIVVRDPSGGRQCYAFERDGVRVFATHPSDVLSVGKIDQVRLAGFLCHPRLSLARTGIAGVEELAPGAVWLCGRSGDSRVQAWRPLNRVRPRAPKSIASDIKSAVQQTALAFTDGQSLVLHRLSGGLDSSIVLAALAAARHTRDFDLVCVNEFSTDVPEGDERVLARLTADRFRARLVEMSFSPRPLIDARAPAAWSPTPGFAALNTGALSFMEAMSAYHGALLTSGQGGDHLFQRNRTMHLASDAARYGELSSRLAMSLARMSGVSVWKVLGHAIAYAPPFRPLRPNEYASPSLIANHELAAQAVAEHFQHPWLEEWQRAAPGEVLRALHVLEATHYYAPSALNDTFTPAPVLVSQPVMEACLSAPTYVMAPGVERGLIRDAFAEDLPPEVLQRTTKGETTRFFVAQLEAQWPELRQLLLDGLLVQQDALERVRVEAMLAINRVPDLTASADLMTCVAAELWLRSLPLQRG